MVSKIKIKVSSDYPEYSECVEILEHKLSAVVEGEFILKVEPDGLILIDAQNLKGPSLSIDYTQGALDFRRRYGQKGGDLIVRAVGGPKTLQKKGTVLDLTFGLGRDAFILASQGWQVVGLERSQVLFEMASVALKKASEHLGTCEIAERIQIQNQDALLFLTNQDVLWDVIAFDPMFPLLKKKSLPKKEMQVLHKLISAPENESESRGVASLAYGRARRLVIKRPLQAARLIDKLEPSVVFKSGSTRFDVYVNEGAS